MWRQRWRHLNTLMECSKTVRAPPFEREYNALAAVACLLVPQSASYPVFKSNCGRCALPDTAQLLTHSHSIAANDQAPKTAYAAAEEQHSAQALTQQLNH